MVERTEPGIGLAYIKLIGTIGRIAKSRGLSTFVVLHSARQDEWLIPRIYEELGEEVEIVRGPDPFHLKTVIGQSQLVFGSRYHGLVAALSQGVPTIGTSWSHKYEGLFEDFRCPEYLVPATADEESCRRLCDEALDRSQVIKSRLNEAGQELRRRVEEMWDAVETVVL
jgi:colanic acid/amylovoran biosynthesis protein